MTGICLYSPKFSINWDQIIRAAFNFNVDFISTIGCRYKRGAADTTDTAKHIPVFHYKTAADFLDSYPKSCKLVSLEVNNSHPIDNFIHPKNAIYIFGPEDGSICEELLDQSIKLRIDTRNCLNVAMCAGITMFHRNMQKL